MKSLGLILALIFAGCSAEERQTDTSDNVTQGSASGYTALTGSESQDETYVLYSEGRKISEHQSENETHRAALNYLDENPFVEVYFTNDIEYERENQEEVSVEELYNFTHPALNNIEWTLKQPLDLEGFELMTKARSKADSIRISYECENQRVSRTIKPENGNFEDSFSADCSKILTRLYAYDEKMVGGYYTVDVGFFNSVDF
jgi:hypothetical protein